MIRSYKGGGLIFLLTPLREGRRRTELILRCLRCYFYSRPCGRGDPPTRKEGQMAYLISTHAPAGGATPPALWPCRAFSDFYSRPCGRGDQGLRGQAYRLSHDFYSRPCGRGDRCNRDDRGHGHISTHAPAGGATWMGQSIFRTIALFLLTPLREGRRERKVLMDGTSSFLLTPLREGRRNPRHSHAFLSRYFYSRPCGRGDFQKWAAESGYNISTHAPAGGATNDGLREVQGGLISTHAPAGGATNDHRCCKSRRCISTHAPAGGATQKPVTI